METRPTVPTEQDRSRRLGDTADAHPELYVRQAEDELRERVRQAELGAAIGVALTSTAPLAMQLQQCVQAVVTHLNVAFARIWTVDESLNMLELRASAGLYTHLNGAHSRVPIGSLKIGRIASTRAPHMTNTVSDDPEVGDKDWARREGMIAFAGYPLLVGDRIVGVLALFARHTITPATLAALGAVADTIGLGIDRARADAAHQATLRAVEADRDRLQQVLDVLPEGVVLADADVRLVMHNAAAREILGTSRVPGAPAVDAQAASDRYATRHLDGTPHGPRDGLLYRSVLDGEIVRAEQLLVRYAGDGHDVPLLASSAPLRDTAGVIAGAVMVFQDITSIKDLELQKDAFLASVSHDLKNPLTAIKGMGQLLARRAARLPALDAQRFAEGLGMIAASVEEMTAQIEELLDLTHLRLARAVELHLVPVDLMELLDGVMRQYRQSTEQHRLILDLPPQAVICICDAPRVKRALANLLSNAIKYSPAGGTIRVQLGTQEDGWATFCVADEGVGIPAKDLPHVFERFYRASNVAGQISGTGIGLAGARQTVEHHGGTITLTSTPGIGTTVILRLPLAGPPAQTQTP